jgi:hypothetical protein
VLNVGSNGHGRSTSDDMRCACSGRGSEVIDRQAYAMQLTANTAILLIDILLLLLILRGSVSSTWDG